MLVFTPNCENTKYNNCEIPFFNHLLGKKFFKSLGFYSMHANIFTIQQSGIKDFMFLEIRKKLYLKE